MRWKVQWRIYIMIGWPGYVSNSTDNGESSWVDQTKENGAEWINDGLGVNVRSQVGKRKLWNDRMVEKLIKYSIVPDVLDLTLFTL